MAGNLRDRFYYCVVFIFWLLLASNGQAQTTLTADQLQDGKSFELDKLGWKYSSDDNPQFADPQFDDRAWATLTDSAKPEDSGWHGSGWFRLHLRVAPQLSNVALNLEMAHYGASEVYVNGKLLKRFGVVGKTREEETVFNPNALPLAVVLQSGAEQVMAVRYSHQQAADVNSFLTRWLLNSRGGIAEIGFHSRIREFGTATSQSGTGYVSWPFPFGYMTTQTTAYLSFGILHLLLFAFCARQRSNLYYGLFLLG